LAAECIKRIHSQKLYLAHYATFEEYCNERLNLSRSVVYRKLKALAVAESLGLLECDACDTLNERQLLELKDQTKEQATEIVATLVREKKPVTAKTIKAMKAKKEPKSFHVLPVDKDEELIKRVRSRLDDPEFVEALSRLLDQS
jgi:hypothetical protein